MEIWACIRYVKSDMINNISLFKNKRKNVLKFSIYIIALFKSYGIEKINNNKIDEIKHY